MTRIEALIRDPYAIFAQNILKLQPLDPVDASIDARTRGTIIHDTLERAIQAERTADVASTFLSAAEIAMETHALSDAAKALWRQRLLRIANWIGEDEQVRRPMIVERFLEVSGALDINLPGGAFRVTGRADRIDILKSGASRIIDYKSGSPPSDKQVHSLLSPQLPIEAAMLVSGGFTDIGPLAPQESGPELEYWRISGGVPAAEIRSLSGAEFAADAIAMLTELIGYYDVEDHGYLPRVALQEERLGSDYDHLSRHGEWSLGGGEEAGA